MDNVNTVSQLHRKPSALKEEISEFKRQRIKEQACHMFYQDGYEATTIDAIAKQLDVTKPFIYSYFKNKSELLFEICNTGVSLSLRAIEDIEHLQKTPAEKLKLAVHAVMRIVITHQAYIVVYEREEKNLDADLSRLIRQQRGLFDHRVAALLESGCELEEFTIKDPVMTATTISGMMTWVAFWYSPLGKWSEAEIIAHVMTMIRAVVGEHIGKSASVGDGHMEQNHNA